MPDDIEPQTTPAQAADAISASEEAASGAPGPDELTMARRERDDYYERLLRQAAEFDNYRKRTDKERREQAERVTGDLLLDVLPVIDDLERALTVDAGADAADAFRAGVELIQRQLLDILKRRGVRAIDPIGQDFDPNLHQAVTTEARPGARDGEVLEEFRRGYLIGERLLRPAMVKVARS
jgi:molecular chaperone GrpE